MQPASSLLMNPTRSDNGRGPGTDISPAGGWSTLSERVTNVVTQFLEGAGASQNAATTPLSSAWYEGMVLEPADFSSQLCRLQVSLQRECAAVGAVTHQTEPLSLG